MLAEKPEVAKSGDRRSCDVVRHKVIRISIRGLLLALDELIDLWRGKAGDGEGEVQIECEIKLKQLPELKCQKLLVPPGLIRQAVQGNFTLRLRGGTAASVFRVEAEIAVGSLMAMVL